MSKVKGTTSMKKRILSMIFTLALILTILPFETTRIQAASPAEQNASAAGVSTRAATVAYPVTGGNIYFNSETGMVTDCDESVTAANIPESIEGVKVIAIGNLAFFNCSRLTSITFPDSVTTIGDHAFYECSSLTSITLPDGVSTINERVFFGCNRLTSVTLPESVTTIGDSAFLGCSSLTSITLPDNVTTIDAAAFQGCISLTSITLPDSVTTIGDLAFYECSSLTSITIPDGNTAIGYSTFAECISLESIMIPDSITIIDEYAFSCCISLENIVIPDSVTTIGNSAFAGCSSLTSIVIPDSVTTIGDFAFCECNSLTSITLPDNITAIGESLFANCFDLTSITLPDSVTTIGDLAFCDCHSLTSITIPDNVMAIGDDAFAGCSSLTDITIPDSITMIGNSVFYRCSSLTSIMLPDSIKSIGENAFHDCDSLTIFTIPKGVKTIGDQAFHSCDNLTSITLSDGITTIGYAAFAWCDNLTDIYFTGSASQWEKFAKKYDFSGMTIHYEETAPIPVLVEYPVTGGNITFNTETGMVVSCEDSVTAANIPEAIMGVKVIGIGYQAFDNCSGLTSIAIPTGVTWIGPQAFDGCDALTHIYYGGSQAQWEQINKNKNDFNSIEIHYSGVTTEPCRHKYESAVTEPTCTENGYTTYTCTICGDTYVTDEVPANGIHDYVDGSCTYCGAEAPDTDANTVISVGDAKTMPGKTIVVPVSIEGNPGIAGYTFIVSCDEGLTLTDIKKGGLSQESDGGALTKNIAKGQVNWTDYANLYGDGEILLLTFDVAEDAVDGDYGISIELKDNKATNFVAESGQAIGVRFESGILTVANVTFGDLGGDGDVTASDSVIVVRYLVDNEELDWKQLVAADVNHDGEVTAADAVRIAKYLVGLVDSLEEDASALKTKSVATANKTNETVVSMETVSGAAGETVTVPVSVEGNVGFAGFTFEISGDEDLTLTDIKKGSLLQGSESGSLTKNIEKAQINWTDSGNVYGDGELLLLTFRIDDDAGSGNYNVSVRLKENKSSNFVNEEGRPIAAAFDTKDASCPCEVFADSAAFSSWAHDGIDYCVTKGLMNGVGDGMFNPAGTLTRAQLVTILYRVAGEPAVDVKGIFTDVPADAWYAKAVEWAAANEIVKGIGSNKFAPDSPISREQIATILFRYDGGVKAEESLEAYSDADKVGSYAVDGMLWAIENEIITGVAVGEATYLNPQDSATREQIAAIMMRYHNSTPAV